MKKALVILAVTVLLAVTVFSLVGCSADKKPVPAPTFSASSMPSETVSGWPTPPNITRPPYDPEQTAPEPEKTTKNNTPDNTAAPTTSEAVPPAVQFAQRWGKKYPSVPEYAILKTANATCTLIEEAGTNWNDNTVTMAAIAGLLSTVDMSDNDALEFAQDANQNYCSSVS